MNTSTPQAPQASVELEALGLITRLSAEWIRFYIETECRCISINQYLPMVYDVAQPSASSFFSNSHEELFHATRQRMLAALACIQRDPQLMGMLD